jgi:hypothetical protein
MFYQDSPEQKQQKQGPRRKHKRSIFPQREENQQCQELLQLWVKHAVLFQKEAELLIA